MPLPDDPRKNPCFSIDTIHDGSEIDHMGLRALWDFWSSRCRDDRLPARSGFLIEDFLPWARHLSIMKLDGGRHVVTLASTTMIELNGCNPTGKTPEEYVPEHALDFAMIAIRQATRDRKAVIDVFRLPAETDAANCWRLTLPCASNGSDIDCFLIGHYYDPGFLGRMADLTVFDRYTDPQRRNRLS
jgi:hypothetical protein